MRITTNAILRNYRSNLGTSMANLDSARNKVMTGRQFVSSAENPGSALRAATLERKYVKNLDYLSTVQNTQSYLDSQEDAAMQISACPAAPLSRPMPPATLRFWMITRMISPKPSVMMAK